MVGITQRSVDGGYGDDLLVHESLGVPVAVHRYFNRTPHPASPQKLPQVEAHHAHVADEPEVAVPVAQDAVLLRGANVIRDGKTDGAGLGNTGRIQVDQAQPAGVADGQGIRSE